MRIRISTLLILGLLFIAPLTAPFSAQAQDQQNDVYDPFIDYSEFEEAGQEEADINFFRNGRLFTAGLLFGQRSFTSNMGDVFDPAVGYGLYFSYFFDMRLALQFSFFTASHDVSYSVSGTPNSGEATVNTFGIDFKYYFNTQNISKGLPKFNPYVLAGFSSISREVNVAGQSDFSKEHPMGFDVGAGFEVPILRNEAFMGVQAIYQVVNFKGEASTDPRQDGDIINLMGLIGLNF